MEIYYDDNIDNLYEMFKECDSIVSIDLSEFNTSNAKGSISGMFDDCFSLKSLYLSNFYTSKISDLNDMFDDILLKNH